MPLTTGLLALPSHPAGRLAELAQLAERTGYDYLWLADERFFREVYASLTFCALRTQRIKLGPCVTDPYSRHPALTAMAIATLDELSGQRAVLGLGAGVSGFRELGIARDKPGVGLREAVDVIRQLLAGETVTYPGSVVRVDGAHLDFKPVRAEIPMYIASQRPVGVRAAGRVANGAIMQGCVAEPLFTFFRDTVIAGAREAGRDPARIDLVARINVCVHDDRKVARDLMIILRRIAERRAVSAKASDEMVKVMLAQKFNEGIPAGLPPNVKVSHKTGSITKINHDAAIVYPSGRKPYVLVVLTRGIEDEKRAHSLIADISRVVYETTNERSADVLPARSKGH